MSANKTASNFSAKESKVPLVYAMAPPVGLEPTTHGLTARCSTILSYGGTSNIFKTL